ncbi:MAG: hypothetical protein KTR32_40150 [Granulosicoccus sp.]|nr:hypothetical protein [Granulosicoccus sp.]
MNPYQIMTIIACCTLIFAGVVTFLTYQGVPLLVAFLSVYLVAIGFMFGMQKRASQAFEGRHRSQRSSDRDLVTAARMDDDSNSTGSTERGKARARLPV